MSLARILMGVLVIGALVVDSIEVCAQNSKTNSSDIGAIATVGSAKSLTPSSKPCSSGGSSADILTDTMGVDFSPFMKGLTKTVRANWYQLMPPSVRPPISEKGKVSIEFEILKNGKVQGTKIVSSSGEVVLDRAAWGSIIRSDPFAALPSEFPGPLLKLRFYFFYNVDPNIISLSITPCGDVQVHIGSTIQFVVSGKGIEETPIKWTVRGRACSGTACGTISECGLYAAPAEIPNPPTVTVQATAGVGPVAIASSTLTVVGASQSP